MLFLSFVDCPNKNKSQSYPRKKKQERETEANEFNLGNFFNVLAIFFAEIQQSYINNNYL